MPAPKTGIYSGQPVCKEMPPEKSSCERIIINYPTLFSLVVPGKVTLFKISPTSIFTIFTFLLDSGENFQDPVPGITTG